MRKLYDAACSLKQFPHRGRVNQEADARELVMTPLPYIVVYRVLESVVEIARIVHTSQDWTEVIAPGRQTSVIASRLRQFFPCSKRTQPESNRKLRIATRNGATRIMSRACLDGEACILSPAVFPTGFLHGKPSGCRRIRRSPVNRRSLRVPECLEDSVG